MGETSATTPEELKRAALGEFLRPGLLVVIVAAVFGWAVGFEFTNWDDQAFIVNNPLLQPQWENIPKLFRPGVIPDEQLYIPITYMSHWLESYAFGLRSSVVHATNVLLHMANVVLVYAIIRRRSSPGVAFAAALLFALHPLQAETVGWSMGRKDLLAAMFGFLSILAWLKCRQFDPQPRRGAVVLVFLCFVLAILSKPNLIVLPLILAAWHHLESRQFSGRSWAAYGLMLVLSIAVFLINRTAAAETPLQPPLAERLSASPALVWHWTKHLLPFGAPAAYYPWPDERPVLTVVLALTVLAAAVALLFRVRSTCAGIGLWWFALAMAPAAQVLISSRRFMTADRYAYFALAGLSLAAAVLCSKRPRGIQLLICLTLVLGLLRTGPRLGVWRSSRTLWQAQINTWPNHPEGYSGLGRAAEQDGRLRAARRAYERAVETGTTDPEVFYNLGNVHTALAQPGEAVAAYRRALGHKPNYVEAMVNLGRALLLHRQPAQAVKVWERAADYDSPYRFGIAMNLARAYLQLDRLDAAAAQAATACRLAPPAAAPAARALQQEVHERISDK